MRVVLTRKELEKIVARMKEDEANILKIDIRFEDEEIDYIDFDEYDKEQFMSTLATIFPHYYDCYQKSDFYV